MTFWAYTRFDNNSFSISMIIKMAKPTLDQGEQKLQKIPYKAVSDLIQTPSDIDYQMYENKLSASFNSQYNNTQLKLNPDVQNLPTSEQNGNSPPRHPERSEGSPIGWQAQNKNNEKNT